MLNLVLQFQLLHICCGLCFMEGFLAFLQSILYHVSLPARSGCDHILSQFLSSFSRCSSFVLYLTEISLQHPSYIGPLRSLLCFSTWWFWVLEVLGKGRQWEKKPKNLKVQGSYSDPDSKKIRFQQNWSMSLALQSLAGIFWSLTWQWRSENVISQLFSVLLPAEPLCPFLLQGDLLTCFKSVIILSLF